jgi:hypothetical protein
MKINKQNIEAIFTFSPKDYFLCYGKDDRFGENGGHPEMVWSLNPRIDRSEKGKDDDIGIPELYLSEEEAEELKKNGFAWLEV